MLHDEGTERGPDDRRDAPDTAEIALHARTVGWRVDVGNDRGRDRDDRAGPQSLERAEGDQRHHIPGDAAKRRADQKQRGACAEYALAAVEVGEPAIDRNSDG